MQIPKDQILELLRSRGENDRAEQADGQLPGTVDTDQHAGILETLGLSPQDLIAQFAGGGGGGGGGGLGGIAGKLGL